MRNSKKGGGRFLKRLSCLKFVNHLWYEENVVWNRSIVGTVSCEWSLYVIGARRRDEMKYYFNEFVCFDNFTELDVSLFAVHSMVACIFILLNYIMSCYFLIIANVAIRNKYIYVVPKRFVYSQRKLLHPSRIITGGYTYTCRYTYLSTTTYLI